MKLRNSILFISLLFLILTSTHIQGQSQSKEDLGNALARSITSNDMDAFKSLLLPKKVFLSYSENDVSMNMDKADHEASRGQSEAQYDPMIIPRYEENFKEMVDLDQKSNINWNDLEFLILYKDSSIDPDYIPFFIQTKLKNSDYSHFYFEAVRYKGAWYLEGKMELTQGNKYAPKQ
jgi:hypothetical protein